MLVSAKEEGDLSELLGMFELGLGELAQFSERLQVRCVWGWVGVGVGVWWCVWGRGGGGARAV